MISEEIWNEIRREDDVLNPVTSLFAACDGKPINVLGQAVCSVEGFGFMGDVDITVVQSLRRGCLLGKDISLKSKSIRSLLDELQYVISNKCDDELKDIRQDEVLCANCEVVDNNGCDIDQSSLCQDKQNDPVSLIVEKLRTEYRDIIAEKLNEISRTHLYAHQIKLTNSTPIKHKVRPVPFALKAEFKKALDEM